MELLWIRANLFRSEIQIRLMQVADCHHVCVVMGEETVEHLVAAISHADESDANAIIRAEHTHAAESCCQPRGCGLLSELPAIEVGHG